MAALTLATSQFPIDKDIDKNLRHVLRHIKHAKAKGAHLVHFSEACLSGYLGVELKSSSRIDWDLLTAAIRQVMDAARQHRIWVIIGCNHPLTPKHKPHNSLYVINDQGKLVNRYDKMFCTGSNNNEADLRHYSPGQSLVTFTVRHVKCGLIICHDFRYPELFRQYKQRRVQLLLASFHNSGMTKPQTDKYWVYVTTTCQAAAASNYFALSANNSTAKHAWPSFVVNAEGLIIDRARSHQPAVLINRIDTNKKLYDASSAWRDRAMKGILHSGALVSDPRSRNRRSL